MTLRPSRGQATVEFALIVPLVLIAMLAIVQVAVLAYTQLAVTHTAREVARVVAVDPSADIGLLVDEVHSLGTDGLHTEIQFAFPENSDHVLVCVVITYDVKATFSIFAPFLNHLGLIGKAKMLSET